ncbi:MAG: DedA family protein [Acidimicrobiales bacterium]|nr:DedA family protein [Acidimicrobiales bacterium]
MVSNLLHSLLSLHGWQVYLLVGVLAFGEAAILLGFVLPGETAVILGGVSANLGHASLVLVTVIAVVAAIAGDSTGYEVGRVIGPRLLELKPIRKRRRAFEAAQEQLRRWGGRAVFVGRFTAFLRAVIPGLAGMSRMPYPKFLLANASGGIVWAVGFTFLGYALGSAYRSAEKYSTDASAVLLAVVILVAVALRVREHRKQRRLEEGASEEEPQPSGAGAIEEEAVEG